MRPCHGRLPFMASLLRVRFPNPFGERSPAASSVADLQKRYGFSDAYAALLSAQNGFRVFKLEEAKGRDAFLVSSTATPSSLDFAQLFNVGELADAQHRIRAIGAWFFAIGKGYGGDQYAEVLHGAHRGCIVHLNKEVFLGTSSFDQIAESYDDFKDFDVDFAKLSIGEQADFLVEAKELDLVARLAPSIDDFLGLCVHCDAERFMGRIVPAPEGTGAKAGAEPPVAHPARRAKPAPTEKPKAAARSKPKAAARSKPKAAAKSKPKAAAKKKPKAAARKKGE